MLEKSDSSLSHILDMQLIFGNLLIDLARIVAHTANECTSKNVICFFRRFADNSINLNIMYAGYYDSVFIFEDKPITIKQLIYYITILRTDNPYGEYYNINISAYLDNSFYYLSNYKNQELFQAFRLPRLCIEQVRKLSQDNTGNNIVTFKPVNINLFSYIREYKVQPRKDN
jgi:hypothetical protein